MPHVSRDRFTAACSRADPETFRAFVVDLFEARGHTVEPAGESLFRLQPGDRLLAVDPRDSTSTGADVIVIRDTGTAAQEAPSALAVEDLHRQICYGVDRDTARTLLARHFDIDRPTERDRADTREASKTPGNADATRKAASPRALTERLRGRWRPRVASPRAAPARRWIPVAASLGFLLALAVLFAVPLGGLSLGGVSGSGPSEATPTPNESVVLTPARVGGPAPDEQFSDIEASEVDVGRPVGISSSYPLGVSASGIVDHKRLVDAYTSVLSNTSYTVRVSYREFVDGRLTGVHTETIRVGNGSRYRASVSNLGEFRTPPREILRTDVFANGSDTYVRSPNAGGLSRPTTEESQYLDELARYLRWSLSVRESSVSEWKGGENETTYLVLMDGENYPGLEDASGNAYVTEAGLIRHAQWSYTRASQPNVHIEFTVQTSNVGETTVTRPKWVDDE